MCASFLVFLSASETKRRAGGAENERDNPGTIDVYSQYGIFILNISHDLFNLGLTAAPEARYTIKRLSQSSLV